MLQTVTEFVTELRSQAWWEALQVVAVSLLLAYLTWLLMTRVAGRLTAHTQTSFDDALVRYLRTPVFVSIALFGVNLALVLADLDETYHRFSLSALKTLVILAWLIFANRFAKLVLEGLSRNKDRFRFIQPQTLPAFGNLTTALILGGATYFLLLAWNVNLSAWVASAGILGLAMSLAARETLANLFAGMSILADAPFSVGDFIVLETGERGEVRHIGLRSSRIQTRDDIEIIVPNSVLANTKIINEAGGPDPRHRVRVKVGVAYGSDIDLVRRVLLEVAAAEPQVCDEPEARVRFRRFDDSALAFELLCWVPEPVMRGRVLDALNSTVYKRFAAEGIEIPFPQRSVYIENAGTESS